ncbi:MAG: hypothetical protein R3F19_03640 [Verrucomicrobiales bacterium]
MSKNTDEELVSIGAEGGSETASVSGSLDRFLRSGGQSENPLDWRVIEAFAALLGEATAEDMPEIVKRVSEQKGGFSEMWAKWDLC